MAHRLFPICENERSAAKNPGARLRAVFSRLPPVPDHPAVEHETLDFWREHGIFDRLREQNAAGPNWSFFDGPITANKRMGVHHMWGRTLKDVFQRYKAMRGFHSRYQNGFDCQGLWVEVGVERELGLNSKREIEEYGLAEFARRCREKVAWSAEVITGQSIRLGMWMDWGNDYYTFSDTNIEYIWRFLRVVNENGWLTKGHRSTEWCPRCGTSISQHELAGYYFETTDPSLYVRFPLHEREGESLVVWTTTPWTLPANVAAAVSPDAEYGLLGNGDWVALARYPELEPIRVARGSELVGLSYAGPFDAFPATSAVEHRVIAWEEVSLDEGSGIVHIAPGCGAADFELSKVHDLTVLAPVDEAGRFYDGYGWLHGLSTVEAKDQIIGDLHERGLLVEAGEIRHRYPFCWRCETPLIFRITDDWFIKADPIRQRLLDANATVDWVPDYFGKRMDDWLRNMGDWNISRKRYFGLPLPFYPCSCGWLTVVGSLDELRERATGGLDQLEELHRPWVDEVTIRCPACGDEEVRRIPEVGDVWLDAGIVPFSTLGWQNPVEIERGHATGAARGLSTADLPDHAYWETWFPADWVSEMREQIRLWFYAQLFMSVVLVDRAPYRKVLSYEKLLDETGREMHGSLGNAIDADEGFERMGADIMRWMYCAQPPSQNLRFGFGPAEEVKRKLLTVWNSVAFLVTYGDIEGFRPTYADLVSGPRDADLRSLDRWLLARAQAFLSEAGRAYEEFMTVGVTRAFEAFVDDLSNWYIRRSRRRFYELDEAAFRTLWYALVQALRVVAPIMPFLCEHLWRNVVAQACEDAPESIFLAGFPEPAAALADDELVTEVAAARQAIELGRAARQGAGIKLRQPLRRVLVCALDPELRAAVGRHVEEVGGELNVKEVELGESPDGVADLRAAPRLDLVGPRLGADLPELRRLLGEGEFTLEDGRLVAGAHTLVAGEFTLEYIPHDGWRVAQDPDFVVVVDARLDDELRLEGRALDVIHTVQRLRREAGFEITDRIEIRFDGDEELAPVFAAHGDRIAQETLAVRVEHRPGEPLSVVKASEPRSL
jgi:isoleucyl-tRNA synthetase